MKLCNYAQNNSEIYLATVTFFNVDLRMDVFSHTKLYIFKTDGVNESTRLRLRIPYWKTFPSMLVVPSVKVSGGLNIMDRYFNIHNSVDLLCKYVKAVREDILEINLL